jgi:hypothetical protein
VRLVDDDQKEGLVGFFFDPRKKLIRLVPIRPGSRTILDDALLNCFFNSSLLEVLEKCLV